MLASLLDKQLVPEQRGHEPAPSPSPSNNKHIVDLQLTLACWPNSSRWRSGSLSSVYALHTSLQLTNSSNRSVMPGSERCLRPGGGWKHRESGRAAVEEHSEVLDPACCSGTGDSSGRPSSSSSSGSSSGSSGSGGGSSGGAPLGQRRHDLGVVADEGGVDALQGLGVCVCVCGGGGGGGGTHNGPREIFCRHVKAAAPK